MSNEELKIHISIAKKLEENKQKNRTRVKVTLMFKMKPQALSTPSDFSEYTVKNFPGYKAQQ